MRRALRGPGVAVLQAPPGAGKTTVVPLRLLDEPWLGRGERIVVLEPRRLAARAAASRMSVLLGEDVGGTVGYRTRDERRVGPATRIEVLTEGILTRRLQRDPALEGTALVVLDEVHERNLQTDLALALALDARRGLRPDLRLLAMSATLDTDRLAALLGGGERDGADGGGEPGEPGERGERGDRPAPVVRSDGRQHPVTIRWAPPPPRTRPAEAAAATILRALREQDGDVLVFLPGAGEIRRTEAALRGGALPAHVDIRPLFGALSRDEQDAALAPSPPGRRRVVLATDIAETSLTVPGTTVVVDAGLARTPRHDARTGLTRLVTGPASKASTDQRAGRAGRTEPGTAYRMWSKLEHAARRSFAEPEIRTVDLAGLALELAVWGADPAELPFLDPPPEAALTDAREVLRALGALDEEGRPTALGRSMAELPLHPRLARIVAGGAASARPADGWTACAIAAALEERDVLRGRPDELPVDLALRVRLVADRTASHPQADRAALAAARRRAGDIARRAAISTTDVDEEACGRLLALGYPDRVAQARSGARFRLRSGGGAWVPAGDPLAAEPFLVVADLDAARKESRVRLAAALHEADAVDAAGMDVDETAMLLWDGERDDLRALTTRRLGDLLLSTTEGPAPAGPATTEALLERVRDTRLAVLRWSDAATSLRARLAFLRANFGEPWPDVSDNALLADLDAWLAPRLAGTTSRRDLQRVDLAGALRARVPGRLQRDLDELAPSTVRLGNGRTLTLAYGGGTPAASARVQDLFGTTTHPSVARGTVPVVVTLLSPAGRPVQITSDLPGFWSGTYRDVCKELAGRYPRHAWPDDPATARPPNRSSRRPGR